MKQAMTIPGVPNSGHGHVLPRPDKAKARCGGPTMCEQCRGDFTRRASAEGQSHVVISAGTPITPQDSGEFSEGEQVALLVAGTINRLTQERDSARGIAAKLEADLTLATDTLAEVIKEWPESTWAHDSLAKENAQEVLDRLTDPEAAPQPSTLDDTPPHP